MAQDPISELRTLVSEALGKFWRPDPERPVVAYDDTDGAVDAASTTDHTTDHDADHTTDYDANAGDAPATDPAPAKAPQNSARFGVASPPAANALREEVADEITEMLHGDRRSFSDLVYHRQDPAEAEATAPLPLGARLKSRGVFEDDWTARTDKDHPWPVILIHGTTDSKGAWQLLGQELRADGWAVFAPDYGLRATGHIPDSVDQVTAYVAAVLGALGAEQAVLVGHSQGGLVARAVAKQDPARVRHVICLGAPNHGTTQGGIISPLVSTRRQEHVMQSIIDSYFGQAGLEQIVGSKIIERLNHGGDIVPGVSYTCIATKQDTIVVPPETCFLSPGDAPDGTVRNIYVQDFDSRAVVLHMDMPMDKRVRAIVRTVLKQLT